VGRSCHHQRTGPNTLHDPAPASVRHPRHAPALARRRTATADEILAKVQLVQANIKKLVDNNAK
jgi:hypothetical protein